MSNVAPSGALSVGEASDDAPDDAGSGGGETESVPADGSGARPKRRAATAGRETLRAWLAEGDALDMVLEPRVLKKSARAAAKEVFNPLLQYCAYRAFLRLPV
jgi:hypothetical protein